MALFVLSAVFGVVHTSSAASGKGQVVLYNWADYIPRDVLDRFTKETGIKVVYSTFESTENMFAKLSIMGTGRASYDVVVPSTYQIGLLNERGLLHELDHSKLPNLKNMDPDMMEQEYDPGNRFSVPYMWGGVGIIVNRDLVKDEVVSWKDLTRKEYAGKLLVTDDLRDLFGVGLKVLGYSVNTRDEGEIRAAYEWLEALRKGARVFSSEVRQPFMDGEVGIGVGWNSTALQVMAEKESLEYIWPAEGSVLWADTLVILKNAPNLENAYKLIDYLMRPEVAAACVAEYMSATANLAAVKLIDQELLENPAFMPTKEHLAISEFLKDVGPALAIYSKYFEKLRANSNSK